MVSASKLKTAFTLGICAAFIAVMVGAAGAAFAGNYAGKYYAGRHGVRDSIVST